MSEPDQSAEQPGGRFDAVDREIEDEFGFEPAVSATGADRVATSDDQATSDVPNKPARTKSSKSSLFSRRWQRRLSAAAVLLVSLIGMGAAYAGFAGSSAADSKSVEDAGAGKQLYEVSCITCHGANLQGVKGRGPSLVQVGSASVYFQVSTGRMPATGQGAEQSRKPAKFDSAQIQQLMAYIESIGGGPELPSGSLRGSDSSIAEGGELFRLNCASCHGTTFRGAPLSAGKSAPSLLDANDAQIYAAMLTGPESMPIFSDNELTPDQKRAIIAYVQTMKASKDPGGNGIGRIGPVSEAIVIWVVGVGALMIAILWIGAKNQ